jgi:2-oxoglutarate dehydrogenase E2 component (dihydrolipoamide succinyltransferase)
MSTQVVMPQMGESVAEGTITKWLKKAGERVERDEPLFEITTDKVDTEVPAPEAGVLEQILVQEGETVAVGTVVATVGDGDTSVAPSPAVSSPSTSEPSPEATIQAPTQAVQQSAAQASKEAAGHFRSAHEPKTFQRRAASPPAAPATATPATPPSAVTAAEPTPESTGGDRHGQLSPVVAALAAKNDLPMAELLSIPGSGRGGRITKKDVLHYLERRTTPAASPPPTTTLPPAARSATAPAISSTAIASATPPARYLYQPEPDDKLVPMSGMRQQIAEHMIWSQQISAQVTSFTECDMHRIVRYRDEHRDRFERANDVPLSFLPFVADATVHALKEFPIFNSSVVGDQIALKKHVHLGIAVALEQGLIVPVVRGADEMNFTGLARAIHTVAEKARTRGLLPADVHGATFTITNPGMFGGLTGTPMIAQPQVAILGLGAIQKKPVVVDDAIAIRPIMVLALTFDHRVIDGATGFQFLERIRVHLEQAELPTG